MRQQFGFTLLELVVVVAVIGILVAVVLPNMNLGGAQARDAERKADLRAVQGALELYRNKYGRYPEGCNNKEDDFNTNAAWRTHISFSGDLDFWSGQAGSGYECSDSSDNNEYILGLAPEFIPRLPTDPRLGDGAGYVYVTNPEGTAYKFMALDTVEAETVDDLHDFARCGDMRTTDNTCRDINSNPGGGNNLSFTHCQAPEFNNDYAVWGGFSNGGIWGTIEYRDAPVEREFFTDHVHCD